MKLIANLIITDSGKVLNIKEKGENKQVGFIAITDAINEKKNRVMFRGLSIDKEYRNRGYGKKLRSAAIRFCKEKGYSEIATDVESYNKLFTDKDLISFYKRNFYENGIKEIEEISESELIAKF